jgi:NADPH-dependent ferric siderophore reductase
MAGVNIIKKVVFDLVEKSMIKKGLVLDVRHWAAGGICEIELSIPDVDLSKWLAVHRLKCKVADYEYRDYTPSLWDAEKKICTLFIDTAHDGFGKRWAEKLVTGDIVLFGPAYASKIPKEPGKMLCIGDNTGIGHFLSIKQIMDRTLYPMEILSFTGSKPALPPGWKTMHPEFEFIVRPPFTEVHYLATRFKQGELKKYKSVCLAGNNKMVSEIKTAFKSRDDFNARIFANEFWS